MEQAAAEKINSRTKQGRDMEHYQHLLAVAVDSIAGKSEEKGIESLFTKGGTVLTATSSQGISDFAVVSYLIRLRTVRQEAAMSNSAFEAFLQSLAFPPSCALNKPVIKAISRCVRWKKARARCSGQSLTER